MPDAISGQADVIIAPPSVEAAGIQPVTTFHTTPQAKENQQPMSPTKKSSDLFEVVTDTWGSSPPIYRKGHILSADTVAPGRDLTWAVRVGAVKLLAEDDPRWKDGPSPDPVDDPAMLGDDGWSHPAFPYQAPVSRVESEAFAATVRESEASASADAAVAAADDAAEAAKVAARTATSTKQRAEAAAKQAAQATAAAEKDGGERPPSSADIQAGADPGGMATGPLPPPNVVQPPNPPVAGAV